jgi:hypothetical protein
MNITEFWSDLCEITPRDKGLAGLRSVLFTCKGIPLTQTIHLQFRSLYHVIRIVTCKILPKTRKFQDSYNGNKYLIYVPFMTSSNWGNIEPILNQLVLHQKEISILTGKGVKINSYKNVCTYQYESVLRNTGLIECFSSFFCACLHTLKFIAKASTSKNIILFSFLNSGVILHNIFLLKIYEKAFNKFFISLPTVFVSTSEFFPFDYTLFDFLKKNKCTTFLLQHGTIGISHYPFIADRIITWGNYFSKQLIMLGTDPKRILEGGMPSSDQLFNLRVNKSNPDNNHIKILILSETHAEYLYPSLFLNFGKFLKTLLEDPRLSNIQFLVKLHPAEDLSFYLRNNLLLYPNICYLDKSISLLDAFSKCNLAVTLFSSAGLQAMIFGLPLLILDLGEPSKNPCVSWPLGLGGKVISSVDEILKLIYGSGNEAEIMRLIGLQEVFLSEAFINQGESAIIISEILENNNPF